MLLDAVRVVVGRQTVNKDLIQRRVRVGGVMALCLLILLEDAGVIGPTLTGGSRKVLVPLDQRDAVLALLAEEMPDD
jgi:hypothetical protein